MNYPARILCFLIAISVFSCRLTNEMNLSPFGIGGFFEVTNLGTASYTVPLDLPVGRVGIQPSLAVNYNSASGNGHLGVGWSLQGLSSIHRIGQSYAKDGQLLPVRHQLSDRFALDGQALIAVIGSYGGHETQYRTERDIFSKIVSYHDSNGVLTHFRVWSKDGRILHYGKWGACDDFDEDNPCTAAIRGRGDVIHAWALKRVEDRSGNYMTFDYFRISNQVYEDHNGDNIEDVSGSRETVEFYPKRIQYTGHINGLAPDIRIQFEYKSGRNDKFRGHQFGNRIQRTRLLSAIKVYQTANGLVHSYELDYEYAEDSGRARLLKIVEKGKDGLQKAPSYFSYTNGEAKFSNAVSTNVSPPKVRMGNLVSDPVNNIIPLDFNGDGKTDIAYPKNGLWHVLLGNSFENRDNFSEEEIRTSASAVASWNTDLTDYWLSAHPLDYNQDGLDDLLLFDDNDTWQILLSTGNDFEAFDTKIDRYEYAKDRAKKNTHILDFNGDGLQDLIVCGSDDDEAKSWRYRLHNGTGFGEEVEFGSILNLGRCGGHKVTILDFDGDGATDLLIGRSLDWNFQAIRYTPNGPEMLDTGLPIFMGQEVDVLRVLDFNGDGLQDVVRVFDGGDKFRAWINTGKTFIGGNIGLPTLDPSIFSDKQYSTLFRGQILDFDGDGRDDILLPVVTETIRLGEPVSDNQRQVGGWKILRSTGDRIDFSVVPSFVFEVVDLKIPYEPYNANNLFSGYSYQRPRVIDANGDLLPDIVFVQKDKFKFYLHQEVQGDLLSEIRTGFLGLEPDDPEWDTTWSHKIIYTPTTDAQVYKSNPFSSVAPGPCSYPQFCMQPKFSVVAQLLDDRGEDVANAQYNFQYFESRGDRLGRGWLGFRERLQIEVRTGRTKLKRFDNVSYDEDQKRYPYQGLIETQWEWVEMDSGNFLIETSFFEYDYKELAGSQVYFPQLIKKTSKTYDQADFSLENPFFIEARAYAYDQFGNLVQEEIDYGNGTKEFTQIKYRNDQEKWLLGLAIKVQEKSLTGTDEATRTSENVYDEERGLLIRTVIEPDNLEKELIRILSYDNFGNVIQDQLLANGLTPRIHHFTYDEQHIFQNAIVNPKGHTSRFEYDRYYGHLTMNESPSGQQIIRRYNTFGLLKEENHSSGQNRRISYLRTENKIQKEITIDGGQHSIIRYDRLRRPIQKTWRGLDNTSISQDFRYTSEGYLAAVSQAHVSTEDATNWVEYGFDKVGRPIVIIEPSGNRWTISYTGGEEMKQDPLGNITKKRFDLSGQIKETEDAAGVTKFFYGTFQQLSRVVDVAGNVSSTVLDAYGQPLSIRMPSAGKREMTYNAFGELIATKDQLGKRLQFEYDVLGRMTKQIAVEGITEWRFDEDDSAIGALSSTKTTWGQEERYQYNENGLLETHTTTIEEESYQVHTSYDDFGRVARTLYPETRGFDRFAVQYDYSDHGYLNKIKRQDSGQVIWEGTATTPSGALRVEHFGNGIQTERTYNETSNSLTEIKSLQRNRQTPFQHLSYTYDANLNISSRANHITQRLETFEYDELNRLTSAVVRDNLDSELTNLFVQYDAIGNITSKSDVGNFIYDANRPHLPTQIGNQSFNYDGNGFQIGRTEGQLEYTTTGLLSSFIDAGNNQSINWQYNANGVRIRARGEDFERIQVGHLYQKEKRQNAAGEKIESHDLYIKQGERILAIVRRSHENNLPVEKTHYLHTDHLGSVHFITDENSNIIEELSFDAFGRRRLPDWTTAQIPTIASTAIGFTGHEHDQDIGNQFIHMKTREYDARTAQFLTPDIVIANPYNSQSWHRYAYVLNNPIRYTDPLGLSAEELTPEGYQKKIYSTSPDGEVHSGDFAGISADGNPIYEMEPITITVKAGRSPDYDSGVSSKTTEGTSNGKDSAIASSSGKARSLGAHLPFTQAGEDAAMWWATKYNDTGGLLYAIGGTFASLWTSETAIQTSITIGTAGFGAVTSAARGSQAAAVGLRGIFLGNAKFSVMSKAYWGARLGGATAAGASLHHWLIPQRLAVSRGGFIADRIVNAGWNLLELPNFTGLVHRSLGLNQYMGFAMRWGPRNVFWRGFIPKLHVMSTHQLKAFFLEQGIRLGIISPFAAGGGAYMWHMGKEENEE